MFSNSLIKCKFFALNSNYTCTNERHARTRACARTHTHTHTRTQRTHEPHFFPPQFWNNAAVLKSQPAYVKTYTHMAYHNQVYRSTTDWVVKSFLGLNSHTIKSETAWWYFVMLSNSKFHNYHFSNPQVFIETEMSRWVIRKTLICNWKYVNTPNHKYSNNLMYFNLWFLNMARKFLKPN
jgi:hypothetical protein